MQFQSTLLLGLVCITSAHLLPEDSKNSHGDVIKSQKTIKALKHKLSSVNWSKVGNWVDENILSRYQGNFTLSAPVFTGKVFGTLGNSNKGLFEKTGYKMLLFDDYRGELEGQLYQKTVLKLFGIKKIKSDVGVDLHWTKDNANVNVNLNKPISGQNATITVDGAGNFKLKNDTDVFIKKLDAVFILRDKSKPNKRH